MIEEVGKDVRNFKRGDRVVVPSTICCGYCCKGVPDFPDKFGAIADDQAGLDLVRYGKIIRDKGLRAE